MRLKNVIGFVLLLLVQFNLAYADHKEGSVAALAEETETLDYYVQNSTLRYRVKEAVDLFSNDVKYLEDCVRYYSVNTVVLDHSEEPGVPRACEYYLRMAKDSFRPVARYLYDTDWDYPRIYRAYRDTRYALYSLKVTY